MVPHPSRAGHHGAVGTRCQERVRRRDAQADKELCPRRRSLRAHSVLAECVAFDQQGLVAVPDYLSYEEAATCPALP